jgi:hypothetical protein
MMRRQAMCRTEEADTSATVAVTSSEASVVAANLVSASIKDTVYNSNADEADDEAMFARYTNIDAIEDAHLKVKQQEAAQQHHHRPPRTLRARHLSLTLRLHVSHPVPTCHRWPDRSTKLAFKPFFGGPDTFMGDGHTTQHAASDLNYKCHRVTLAPTTASMAFHAELPSLAMDSPLARQRHPIRGAAVIPDSIFHAWRHRKLYKAMAASTDNLNVLCGYAGAPNILPRIPSETALRVNSLTEPQELAAPRRFCRFNIDAGTTSAPNTGSLTLSRARSLTPQAPSTPRLKRPSPTPRRHTELIQCLS